MSNRALHQWSRHWSPRPIVTSVCRHISALISQPGAETTEAVFDVTRTSSSSWQRYSDIFCYTVEIKPFHENGSHDTEVEWRKIYRDLRNKLTMGRLESIVVPCCKYQTIVWGFDLITMSIDLENYNILRSLYIFMKRIIYAACSLLSIGLSTRKNIMLSLVSGSRLSWSRSMQCRFYAGQNKSSQTLEWLLHSKSASLCSSNESKSNRNWSSANPQIRMSNKRWKYDCSKNYTAYIWVAARTANVMKMNQHRRFCCCCCCYRVEAIKSIIW